MVLAGARGAGRVSLVPSTWLMPALIGANDKQRTFVCCLWRGGNGSSSCLVVAGA